MTIRGVGQRVHKPLLGVADTNHLLSIHIWVMLGNAEQLIWVREWLRAFQVPCPTGIHATETTAIRGGSEGQNEQMCELAPKLL